MTEPMRFERLETMVGELERQLDLHADINRRTAAALGKPTEGEGSSWHDIPECVTKLCEENERLSFIKSDHKLSVKQLHNSQKYSRELEKEIAKLREEKERLKLKISEFIDGENRGPHPDTLKYERARELLKAWEDAYTAYLDLDRTEDHMFEKPFDATRAFFDGGES